MFPVHLVDQLYLGFLVWQYFVHLAYPVFLEYLLLPVHLTYLEYLEFLEFPECLGHQLLPEYQEYLAYLGHR